MSKVRLAIRVRPFTDRELKSDRSCEPVVRVEDQHTLSITNLKVAASGAGDSRTRVRRYQADYCLDSSCAPDHPNYASQDKVYATVGQEVLKTVLGGRSACVLAYGQSATGKTHSMLGTAAEPGLVPRLCRDLAAPAHERHVTVSFLEIYNERVRDLLCEEAAGAERCASLPRRRGNCSKDLRVREHPARGPYVQNLRCVVVHDPEQLCALVRAGAERRRAAATRRNALSSRSHALLQLTVGAATLHLADLAGSEKAALDDRQKEGANINKSLVALSNVISALVCGGGGGGGGGGRARARYVPYRDSALTWLLKDCFTGGAATFILATVSASGACYSESASTLRWAERARQLPARGGAARGPAAATARLLGEQLAALRAALLKHHIRFIPETGVLEHDPKFWSFSTDPIQETKSSSIVGDEVPCEMNSLNNSNTLGINSYGSNESSITSTSSDRPEDKHSTIGEKAVDNIFGPSLERAVSGHDFKVAAPLRSRRRQYRSHEVLPTASKHPISSRHETSSLHCEISDNSKLESENIDTVSLRSDEYDQKDSAKVHVPFQTENPRAEIVASVTERLYTKLKKKEQSAFSKVENVVDKKIMEPLHELKICTNARQRLVELSQRALRTRRKIGIPAHTQTRAKVTRMKDQIVDVQTDLEPYCIKYDTTHKYYINVSTETEPMTPRCKEVAAGPATGSLHKKDSFTLTEDCSAILKSCSIMTDETQKSENSTQTKVVPPPRKKKSSAFTKYLDPSSSTTTANPDEDTTTASIINISISHSYPAESESLSDDSLEILTAEKPITKSNMPPDLLSNHNSIEQEAQLIPLSVTESRIIDTSKSKTINEISASQNAPHQSTKLQRKAMEADSLNQTISKDCSQIQSTINGSGLQKNCERVFSEGLFSDNDEPTLPSSTGNPIAGTKCINDMILGRNLNVYPYNITLSPNIARNNNCKKSVKFEEEKPRRNNFVSVGTQTLYRSRMNDEVPKFRMYDRQINTDNIKLTQSRKQSFRYDLPRDVTKDAQSARSLAQLFKSDLSIQNLTDSIPYEPMYHNIGSPRCERATEKSHTFKRFLFDSEHRAPVIQDNPFSFNTSSYTSQTSPPLNYPSDDSSSELETDFINKIKFFEHESGRSRDRWLRRENGLSHYPGDAYNNITKSCERIEKSIEAHEEYIRKLDGRRAVGCADASGSACSDARGVGRVGVYERGAPRADVYERGLGRAGTLGLPPSDYLQQLIQVRRNVVNESKQNYGEFHSFHGFV